MHIHTAMPHIELYGFLRHPYPARLRVLVEHGALAEEAQDLGAAHARERGPRVPPTAESVGRRRRHVGRSRSIPRLQNIAEGAGSA